MPSRAGWASNAFVVLVGCIAWNACGGGNRSTIDSARGDGAGRSDARAVSRDFGLSRDLITEAVVKDAGSAATELLGTVLGESFGSASNALSTVEMDAFGNMTTLVDVTDAVGVCAIATSGGQLPDGHVLAMSLYGPTIGAVTGPVTLSVSSSFTPTANSAFVHWSKNMSGCNIAQVMGITGTVTITKVDSAGIDGTLDIHFPAGDHLTGRFVAPPCAALSTWSPPHGSGC